MLDVNVDGVFDLFKPELYKIVPYLKFPQISEMLFIVEGLAFKYISPFSRVSLYPIQNTLSPNCQNEKYQQQNGNATSVQSFLPYS